jgi:hypothetical protein
MRITKQNVIDYIANTMSDSYSYQAIPESIKVIEDPQVRGTFAARFNDKSRVMDQETDLLFITNDASNADDPEDYKSVLEATLEEVEFETWPPKSGNLNFFGI